MKGDDARGKLKFQLCNRVHAHFLSHREGNDCEQVASMCLAIVALMVVRFVFFRT
jgi:hypothetical protein